MKEFFCVLTTPYQMRKVPSVVNIQGKLWWSRPWQTRCTDSLQQEDHYRGSRTVQGEVHQLSSMGAQEQSIGYGLVPPVAPTPFAAECPVLMNWCTVNSVAPRSTMPENQLPGDLASFNACVCPSRRPHLFPKQ